jgi:hypothetical protein
MKFDQLNAANDRLRARMMPEHQKQLNRIERKRIRQLKLADDAMEWEAEMKRRKREKGYETEGKQKGERAIRPRL